MTKEEVTYAEWMNVLGSDPLPAGPLEQGIRALRVVAESSGDIDRLTSAYRDVLRVMPPGEGKQSLKLVEALVRAAQTHHVRYIPGLPLLVEGLDCSPEHVRELIAERDRYRNMYTGEGSDPVPHWIGCACSPACRSRAVEASA